ncbi:uncharacterized protein LOC108916338 [Anoplophora glabripennis]|uniref:uncharacterized protein LOC108916338 n=1 Tax=Anoplophora glabripennis TaxID=217634 RepID=UPI0008743E62|nr:uncharacterized protein LOC108916338 [Anoplophora glabripennis]
MEMNLKFTCLTSVVIFFVLVQEGLSIKCWDCRSDVDPKCSDPFDNTTFAITDCSKATRLETYPLVQATMCRKMRQKVNGVWKYIRSCAYLGEPGIKGDERFCLMRTGTYNIFMEYCTCNTKDGCNISSHLKSSNVLLLGSILSFILFKVLR